MPKLLICHIFRCLILLFLLGVCWLPNREWCHPPPFFPDNGLFQRRPAMLDGTGFLLAGCWTSRENFSAVFCLRTVAAAEAAVVTLFFLFLRGAQRLPLICIHFSESGPSAVKRRQARGGLGGGKATDDRGIVYVSVWIFSNESGHSWQIHHQLWVDTRRNGGKRTSAPFYWHSRKMTSFSTTWAGNAS